MSGHRVTGVGCVVTDVTEVTGEAPETPVIRRLDPQ